EDAEDSLHTRGAGPPSGAVHRKLADALEEPRHEPAANAPTMEQLDLGRKREPPPDHCRHQERIAWRNVVADQNRRTGLRDVPSSADRWPEEQPAQRGKSH